MSTNQTSDKAKVGTSILLALFAVFMLAAAFWRQLSLEKNTEAISNQVSEQVTQEVTEAVSQEISRKNSSEYPDFDYLGQMKSLPVASNFESWTPKSKLDSTKMITRLLVNQGELTKAYFLVEVVQQDKPLTKWESIYLKLNNVGGHLFRPQSLKTPPSESTRLLFALDDIPYLSSLPYSDQRTPLHANWFEDFKPNAEIEVVAFLSSLKPAEIKNITLYYECAIEAECDVSVK